MKKITALIKNFTLVLSASTLAFSGISHASGSFSGGTVANKSDAQYHQGKSVLKKKLKCSGCPLESMTINKNTAPDIINKIDSGSLNKTLNNKESSSLKVYLERRYKL